ncbi:voltage-dependent calcium channel subunit alpha-2/delta-3 isoform X2 [Cephus cinctus]|uniref:Voltage-dependent calcium channel subunit alpha-2/delta-3 isoform X2 n=1 Tax=Cephus cinctus TaxID=211228 RepID=A0AAJ7BJV4_CEPCN|nr:voltage-dependent calcium channel subunit alpha-2/delta-3 isoform X2 [Cephus cinctus]
MKVCFLPAIVFLILTEIHGREDGISFSTVKTWANKLGFELSQLGKYVTNVEKFHESYKLAEVKPQDGNTLVKDIAKDIKAMMELKISAINRIMDVAETSALSAMGNESLEKYNYVNTKNNTIDLTYSEHFGGYVNQSMSAVHVPTNVYDRADNVLRAIKWSEELDKTFIHNYEQDPSLSWQYFGSATGFMRQYPAIRWPMDPSRVDLFDCRTRSWYIEAATSPKDVLILVDNSGSMTGLRKQIARHVVNNILDTLGNNDFVNVITFSDVMNVVVPCFNESLVQANLANVRELKNAITNMQTDKIANFSAVLIKAFEILEVYRTVKEGARCNQAIMLITDGVPENYKEIFKEYNWQDNPEHPEKADMPVRVFTYLIGREVADVREVNWMACANRGYYVHLSTPAEVREQVLNYVPVMARPLVLGQTDHPRIWTPIYADITDPKMTDWRWEQKECKEQKERFQSFRKDPRPLFSKQEKDRRFVQKQKRINNRYGDLQEYKLMTSVSMPVFDRRKNANITEQVLVNEAYWVTETRETRIADLLGVAGTDVPIQEIQKLMMPHMLGVNGYAFIVTNNGYILIHPDLRPVFQEILKPSYNSVDMAEVELMDQDNGPREFEEGILELRKDVINQANGSATLHTKYHYDDMKRVGRVRRKYDYMGIENTPFTVVVSLPEYDHAGSYRVHASEEIHRSYVSGGNWRVHPDWMYCIYHYEAEHIFNTSEKQLLHFLERIRQPGWKWNDSKQRSPPPERTASNSGHGAAHRKRSSNPNKADRISYYCDRNLLQSLVFDAKVTEWFANTNTTREDMGPFARLVNLLPRKEFTQRFGFTLAFVATRSGLTRWQDFPRDDGVPADDHFSKLYPRAIDEVWYKRAVEQYYVHPDSFVFSVPFDKRDDDNTTLVTASRAIFVGTGKAKAPAAVVGFQFQHSALQGLFHNITYNCDSPVNCQKTCKDDSIACYLMDNNGYIIAANNPADAGKFLGEVRGPIMNSLVDNGIYSKIRIFDYQAVCFDYIPTLNHGNVLLTPWRSIQKAAAWLFSQVAWAWAKAGLWTSDYVDANEENEEGLDDQKSYVEGPTENKDTKIIQLVQINRTRPQPCDQEVYLYLLRNASSKEYDVDIDSDKSCERPYVVQPVHFTNMILLVVDVSCPDTDEPILSVVPEEVLYSNYTLACYKALHSLARKRPASCIRNHTKESDIKDLCGFASTFSPNLFLLLLLCALTRFNRY